LKSFTIETGLNRTGKSCRLRWLNYLRPDIRRGDISLQEQFIILELHSRWGNRYETFIYIDIDIVILSIHYLK